MTDYSNAPSFDGGIHVNTYLGGGAAGTFLGVILFIVLVLSVSFYVGILPISDESDLNNGNVNDAGLNNGNVNDAGLNNGNVNNAGLNSSWYGRQPLETGTPEVYYYGNGYYNLTVDDVARIEQKTGASVATLSQLEEAQKHGAQWCARGIFNNNTGGATKYQYGYPMQVAKSGCGNKVGVIRDTTTRDDKKYGMLLYGIKPSETQLSELEIKKGCSHDQSKCILPFNKTQWGRY